MFDKFFKKNNHLQIFTQRNASLNGTFFKTYILGLCVKSQRYVIKSKHCVFFSKIFIFVRNCPQVTLKVRNLSKHGTLLYSFNSVSGPDR